MAIQRPTALVSRGGPVAPRPSDRTNLPPSVRPPGCRVTRNGLRDQNKAIHCLGWVKRLGRLNDRGGSRLNGRLQAFKRRLQTFKRPRLCITSAGAHTFV